MCYTDPVPTTAPPPAAAHTVLLVANSVQYHSLNNTATL